MIKCGLCLNKKNVQFENLQKLNSKFVDNQLVDKSTNNQLLKM
jgi:hypothetical protein